MITDDKYLVFDSVLIDMSGLDHRLFILKCAIKEAIRTDRILVLRKFHIGVHHNFSCNPSLTAETRKTRKYIDYEDYINLTKTKIYQLKDDGTIGKIEKSLRYVKEEGFDLSAYTDNPKLVMKPDKEVGNFLPGEPTPVNDQVLFMRNTSLLTNEQNNQYKVVVRRTNHYNYKHGGGSFVVNFSPSEKVERLTDIVLKSMGTCLNDVKKRYDFNCQSPVTEIKNNYRIEFSQKYFLYYACLHVRANDMLFSMGHRYSTNRHHLKNIIKYAIPKNSIIYVMADIKDPHYFDFLKKDYTVYRYFDFPELKALIFNEKVAEIDNAMLYSVEKNIMQYAHTKLLRAREHLTFIYTNSSHGPSWRYKIFDRFAFPGFYFPGFYIKNRYLLLKSVLKRFKIIRVIV